jgi:hypothetical protein
MKRMPNMSNVSRSNQSAPLVHGPHARHLELVLRDLRLEPEKAAKRQRAQMPDHFDRRFVVAVLDGGYVGEVVVALRRVVVKPAHDVEDTRRRNVHGRLRPNDIDATNRIAELLA